MLKSSEGVCIDEHDSEMVYKQKLVTNMIMAETVQGKSSFCNLSKEVHNLHKSSSSLIKVVSAIFLKLC